MRACLTLALLACAVTGAAHASDANASMHGVSPATSHRSASSAALKSASSFSLEPVTAEEPLIKQASLTVKAPSAISKDGFSQAPLPDDDVEAPRARGAEDDASLRADFFQRNHHQVGDALAGGAAVNDQRRGHGSMAAGVAVAIPMD
ncbi:hypothetical protein [Asaia astilbis]|uniref:hypothetical protein n=1 Tax=Asaia astilbis TaxID=610244 RepID=UPI00046F752E|nr:hypothetical protein [Asaia astilbis]